MHRRHLMKMITTTGSVRKADSSLDSTLNPVELPSKEIVSWGIAFPRPGTRVERSQQQLLCRVGCEDLAT
jgi:hypothetical protein